MYRTPDSQLWEEPMRLSAGDGSLQFFPWLDVGEDGRVHVIWGDTMGDPSYMTYHVVYARVDTASGSIEYGQVTDYASLALGVFFIGDYFTSRHRRARCMRCGLTPGCPSGRSAPSYT